MGGPLFSPMYNCVNHEFVHRYTIIHGALSYSGILVDKECTNLKIRLIFMFIPGEK